MVTKDVAARETVPCDKCQGLGNVPRPGPLFREIDERMSKFRKSKDEALAALRAPKPERGK